MELFTTLTLTDIPVLSDKNPGDTTFKYSMDPDFNWIAFDGQQIIISPDEHVNKGIYVIQFKAEDENSIGA